MRRPAPAPAPGNPGLPPTGASGHARPCLSQKSTRRGEPRNAETTPTCLTYIRFLITNLLQTEPLLPVPSVCATESAFDHLESECKLTFGPGEVRLGAAGRILTGNTASLMRLTRAYGLLIA
ncbi:hypothetical protein KM043_015540 [Ampulex compressa]|nr:hypothetical protein KM043_015540 [Ampulex compressa]